jgi:hypothetical protein
MDEVAMALLLARHGVPALAVERQADAAIVKLEP